MFGKIKEGTKAYGAGADEQAALMQKVLELNGKRIKIADEWDAQLHKLLASRASPAPTSNTICAMPMRPRTRSAPPAGVSSSPAN